MGNILPQNADFASSVRAEIETVKGAISNMKQLLQVALESGLDDVISVAAQGLLDFENELKQLLRTAEMCA